MKKVVFLKNAAVLTATSLLLRFLGVIMKVWLAAQIGSEGIGLYQLIFSFFVLAATFATSGICTAVTRLVAEESCIGTQNGISKIMSRSFLLTVICAVVSFAAVFFGAAPIAKYIIHDMRAVPSLKIISFALVFMGISSCIKGYFLARRKSLPPSTSQIFEHTVRIAAMMFLVKHFMPYGTQWACYGVFLADVISEIVACVYLYFFYRHDKFYLRNLAGRATPDYPICKKILHISLPITSGRYINSILRTAENTLVPAQLMLYGMSSSEALSSFGMIKGMVLPLLFFPSSLLGAFSALLIPEISEARTRGYKKSISRMTASILRITSLVGFLFGAIFFVGGREIGVLVYKNAEVGELIRRLAPIVPLMYLDSIADGMLKGMDQQAATFRYSVADSAMRIILVMLLLKNGGMDSFLLIMYISNLLTCLLNCSRLIVCTSVKPRIVRGIILPVLTAAAVGLTSQRLLSMFNMPNLLFVSVLTVICTALYFSILLLCGCMRISDLTLRNQ